MQVKLDAGQVEAFYHDEFVNSQVRNFISLVGQAGLALRTVVDVGGGCGYFAAAVKALTGVKARVIDTDPVSIAACHAKGLEAFAEDALHPQFRDDEDVVCLNLILHHLIGRTEAQTLDLQQRALGCWHGQAGAVFVDEYIYDSYFGTASGKLIYWITRSRLLSAVGRAISRLVPSMRANTFGVGVRFRSRKEWIGIFNILGYRVIGEVRGSEETVSTARRLLLIRSCRRDSFLLSAA